GTIYRTNGDCVLSRSMSRSGFNPTTFTVGKLDQIVLTNETRSCSGKNECNLCGVSYSYSIYLENLVCVVVDEPMPVPHFGLLHTAEDLHGIRKLFFIGCVIKIRVNITLSEE